MVLLCGEIKAVGTKTLRRGDAVRQNTTHLEDLAEALFDFVNVEDLVAWLNGQEG